ncbi:MAG TPA: pilus assembly protein TadG-related protein [Actinomycetes bacterium]
MLVFLVGLVVLVLMVLALGWDTSNWFLGHRALDDLADGAAVAAAGELDTRAYYASEGREVALLERRAEATVGEFVAAAAGDSGVRRVEVASVVVRGSPAGPVVAVELEAGTPVGLLRLLGVVPPRMVGGATAVGRVVAP